jgi:hypothetical protein
VQFLLEEKLYWRRNYIGVKISPEEDLPAVFAYSFLHLLIDAVFVIMSLAFLARINLSCIFSEIVITVGTFISERKIRIVGIGFNNFRSTC